MRLHVHGKQKKALHKIVSAHIFNFSIELSSCVYGIYMYILCSFGKTIDSGLSDNRHYFTSRD